MGWIIASACNSKSQKRLTIDISPSNIYGYKIVDLFIQYVREKDNTISYIINNNDYFANDICIKYYANDGGRIIYKGSDLNETFFDSLYRQIILIND